VKSSRRGPTPQRYESKKDIDVLVSCAVSLGFCIYPDLRLLFIRGQGVITQAERIRTMMAWLRDPQYECCSDALFDVAAAESTPTVGELRELIAVLEQHMPSNGPRQLAVVTSKPIAFIVARIFENLLQLKRVPLQVRVFMDQDRAWSWLRPDTPPFQPR
jgi:hypothetical protein